MIFILSRAILNDKTKWVLRLYDLTFNISYITDELVIAKIWKVVNCLGIGSIYLLTFICSKCFSESNFSISPRFFSNMEL